VPVALIGVLYFVFVLGIVALCQRSATAAPNLSGYLFAVSTLGLAAVLYFAYASFFVLGAVCLLCIAVYIAIIGLFLLSGARTAFPMTSLPGRIRRDVATLVRTPAALSAAIAFLAAAAAAIAFFPGQPVAAQDVASTGASRPAPSQTGTPQSAVPPSAAPQAAIQQLEEWLSKQPRVPIVAPGDGAAVVIVKFNDYQCPPCRQTFLEYKPVLAKFQQQQPGKVKFITKDFPLEPECNSSTPNELHPAACEAAAAVRLAREKGKADAMEDWLFANQPSLTGPGVREAARTVGGVGDLDARYAAMLELVRGDVAQGVQLGVRGTPTFFMNGIRLPGLPAAFFEAAIAWELRRVSQ
jgi:protein-disulfide isomerase